MAALEVSDQIEGKAVSRDRFMEKPRHQEGLGEAGMKIDSGFPLKYGLTCAEENFTA